MNKPPPSVSTTRTARQLRTLQRIAAIGIILARQLLERVETGAVTEDPSLAFSRLSGAVRETIMLERKLADQAASAAALKPAVAPAAQRPKAWSRHTQIDDLIDALIKDYGVETAEAVMRGVEQWLDSGRVGRQELACFRAEARGGPKPKPPEPSPVWPFDPHPPGAPPRRPDG